MQIPIISGIATSLISTGTTALAKGYHEINIDITSSYIDSLSDQELAQLDQMLNDKEYIEIEEYHKHI